MSKRLKNRTRFWALSGLSIALLTIGLAVGARRTIEHQINRQIDALRANGVEVTVRTWTWSGIRFDLAVPSKGWSARDVALNARIVGLWPLRFAFQFSALADLGPARIVVRAPLALSFGAKGQWYLKSQGSASEICLENEEPSFAVAACSIDVQYAPQAEPQWQISFAGRDQNRAASVQEINFTVRVIEKISGRDTALQFFGRGKNRGANYRFDEPLNLNFHQSADGLNRHLELNCGPKCGSVMTALHKIPVGELNAKVDLGAQPSATQFRLNLKRIDLGFLKRFLPGLVPPSIQISVVGSQKLNGSWSATSLLSDSEKNFTVESRGVANAELSTGAVTSKLKTSFSPYFEPKSLYPDLAETWQNILGYVVATATVNYTGNHIQPVPIELKILDVGGIYNGVPFSGLHSVSQWTYLPQSSALKTGKTSSVQLVKIGKELAFEKLSLDFGYNSNQLAIKSFTGLFNDGALSATPFSVNFQNPTFITELAIRHLDLKKTLAGLQFSTLSGEGKLDGFLPIEYGSSGLFIRDAHFQNVGDGSIRYRDPSATSIKQKIATLGDFNDLLSRGQQALAFKALDNFHYSYFLLKGNRDPKLGINLRLDLKGSNPDIASGQRFELAIPISGDVESLLMQTLIESMVERSEWETKIRKFLKNRAHR